MNNEIKEINLSEMLFNRDERLLDYITNLQKENKKLDSQNTINRLYWEKLEQRIDKAIEYIQNTTLFTENYDYDYEENLVWNGATDEKERQEIHDKIKQYLQSQYENWNEEDLIYKK